MSLAGPTQLGSLFIITKHSPKTESASLKTPYIIVLATTANKQEAETIVNSLLEAKLIACGNILSNVASLFSWGGKNERAEECLILLKSRKDLFEKISNKVKALHSYEVPEIIALEISQGSDKYLEWIENSL